MTWIDKFFIKIPMTSISAINLSNRSKSANFCTTLFSFSLSLTPSLSLSLSLAHSHSLTLSLQQKRRIEKKRKDSTKNDRFWFISWHVKRKELDDLWTLVCNYCFWPSFFDDYRLDQQQKNGFKPVLLLYSLFFLPYYFIGGKRKRVENKQFFVYL